MDVPRKTQSDHSVLRQKRLQRGEDAVLAHAPMHPRGAGVEHFLSAHNTPVDVGLLLPARSLKVPLILGIGAVLLRA